jgi:hypothetical protein
MIEIQIEFQPLEVDKRKQVRTLIILAFAPH